MSAGSAASDIAKQDIEHVWHPMMQHSGLQEKGLMVIREAHGTTVVDEGGREYLDAYAGLWNVNVGYGRKEIADAVYKQMNTLSYYPHLQANEPAAALAAKLAEITPGDLTYTFYSNSGSEAAETALKIARQYARQTHPGENRFKIIARYRGYHGFTYGAMSATGQVARKAKFEPLVPGFLHVNPPYCHRCPVNLSYPSCGLACVEEFEEVIVREGPETVAAIIAEPIIGGGGVLVPPDDYLPRLREICDTYGILLILDEVITGFGRTGELFGCNHYDVVPDIMNIAKGLTSGYLPMGASVVSPKVYEAFLGDPGDDKEFSQVATYGGHPVCSAAALANIDILMGERLWQNSASVGAHLLRALQAIDSPFIGDVRGKGLMITVDLQNEEGDLLDTARTAAVQGKIKEQGVLVGRLSHVLQGPENLLFISPPLILTADEADRIAEAVRAGVASLH